MSGFSPWQFLRGKVVTTGMIRLGKCQRIVVKVGTSSLTHSTGKIELRRMELLVRQIADLSNGGREMILVSSGAVGVGMGKLNYGKPPKTLPEKQALAAVGQGGLMHIYEKLFAEYDRHVAQLLLTRDVFADPQRYLNVRNTLAALLDFGTVPIINENDPVAAEELRFGDNDTLAASVAVAADADLLVILSDIDGLYDADPRQNPKARIIPLVREITEEMLAGSQSKGSPVASGGMWTKLLAARIAMSCGIPMVVASGNETDPLRRLLSGERLGTLFVPRGGGYRSKRRWLAAGSAPAGKIRVDSGAARVLSRGGRSLLPSGVVTVEGRFERGDVVAVVAPEGKEVVRGIVNFSDWEVARIAGRHTHEIELLLGRRGYDEVISRNNLVLV